MGDERIGLHDLAYLRYGYIIGQVHMAQGQDLQTHRILVPYREEDVVDVRLFEPRYVGEAQLSEARRQLAQDIG